MKKSIKILMVSVVMMVCFTFSSFGKTESNSVNSESFNKTQKTSKTITSIQMSNGKTAFYHWRKTSSGKLVLEGIKFEGGKFIKCSVLEEAGTECRDAAVDAALALVICATSGGASIPCAVATAKAAYSAYKCWEATRPREALEMETLSLIFKPNKKIIIKQLGDGI